MTPEVLAKAHSPEVRKKAAATLRRTLKARKAAKLAAEKAAKKGGTVTHFDVGDLPPRPKKKGAAVARKKRPSDAEKVEIMRRIEAARARGVPIKEAAIQNGCADGTYYKWSKDPALRRLMKSSTANLPAKLNGHAQHNGHELNGRATLRGSAMMSPAMRSDVAVGLTIMIGGNAHTVSLDEASAIRDSLDDILGARLL